MQMVAATKMRKSQQVALAARPYAKLALGLLSRILRENQIQQMGPLVNPNESGKDALVVVTSDKGLAGSFNGAVLRAAWNKKEELEAKGRSIEIVAVGRKAKDFFGARGYVPAESFLHFSDIVSIHDIIPLADWIIQAFKQGKYGHVYFSSTLFLSALVQKPKITQVLPLEASLLSEIVAGIVPKTGKYADLSEKEDAFVEHLFEPSRFEIAERLCEDLTRVQIAHILFESNASEHSARMIAMKNATENAQQLQETLVLQLNKARQAGITQEVAEISTAKEALQSEV